MIEDDPGPEFEPPLLDGGGVPAPARRWPLGAGTTDPHVRRRAMWAMGVAAVLFAGGVIGLGLPSNGSGNDNVRLAASDTTVDTVPSSGVGASTGALNVKPVFTPIEFAAPPVQPTSTVATSTAGAPTTTVAPGLSPFAGASGNGSLAGFFVPPTTVPHTGTTSPAKTGTTTGTTRPTVPSATTLPQATTLPPTTPTAPPTTRPPRTTTTTTTIPTTPPTLPPTDPPTTTPPVTDPPTTTPPITDPPTTTPPITDPPTTTPPVTDPPTTLAPVTDPPTTPGPPTSF